MNIKDMQRNAREASSLLNALSNERRLMILCQLAEGEKSVGQLQPLLGLSQSALSQHLARLRKDGLVHTRRDSQTIYYTLASKEAHRLIDALYGIYCVTEAAPEDKRPATA
jgi:DNA-binding transcriptional ArsR family regulator